MYVVKLEMVETFLFTRLKNLVLDSVTLCKSRRWYLCCAVVPENDLSRMSSIFGMK